MANGIQATKVVTGKCRLSYVHVFEPWSNDPDKDARYSTVILIPKKDKATYAKLMKAEEAAKQNGMTSKWGGKIPKNLKPSIVKDGDEDADLDKNPEFEGHWYMTVSSNTKPGVVDQNLNAILDSTEVYSGCYARVSINAYPYSVSGNNGVTFGLNNLQKLADGEPFGGRARAEDDFDAIEDDEEDLL